MRIIAFVGSPVEDNEKEVSLKSCCANATEQKGYVIAHSPTVYITANVRLSFFLHPNLLLCHLLFLQLVKLAKRLKKEKVNVDIINFGEAVRTSWFINQCTAIGRVKQRIMLYILDVHIPYLFPFIN